MSNQPVVRPITLAPNEISFYNTYGYLYIPGFIDPQIVQQVTDEVWAISEAHGVSRQQMKSSTDPKDRLRQFSTYLKGSKLDEMINGRPTLGIAGQLAGGDAVRYLPFTAIKAGGGGGVFDFHQDNNYTQHEPAAGSLNIWVALSDMTPENGCLQIVPGSHLHGNLEAEDVSHGDGHRKVKLDPTTFLPLRMRAGDAVAFTRLTVHGSGPNVTDEPRVAYALQYHRSDVSFLDKKDNSWKKLVETERFQTKPVDALPQLAKA